MRKATIAAAYEFIVAMEGQSDDAVTLALQKEFFFSSTSNYLDVKDFVQTTRKLRRTSDD